MTQIYGEVRVAIIVVIYQKETCVFAVNINCHCLQNIFCIL